MKFESIEDYYSYLRTPIARSQQSRAGKQSQKLHPELSSERMKRTLKLYPGLARRAGNRSHELHPNLVHENEILIKKLHPNLYSENGKLVGRRNAESGQIFKVLEIAQNGIRINHRSHVHRSRPEFKKCSEIQPLYRDLLHYNVKFGCLELDWVVGIKGVRFDSKNPKTWSKVIEHHVVRFWRGETSESYNLKRGVRRLRSLGVTCEIEIICVERGLIRRFRGHNLTS